MARRQVSTSLALTLPTVLNEPPSAFEDQCAMIFGRKSWGKSTLLSQWPDIITMMLEPHRRNLQILQIPKEGEPRNWETILEYIGLFIESDYQRLGIDTLDRFYQAALKWACLDLSNGEFDSPTKVPEDDRPSYYIYSQKVYEETLESIKDSGKTWIVTSHDTKRTTKRPITGEKEERIEPTCSPSAWKIAQSMCDYVFHVEFRDRQRILTIRDLDNITLASCGRGDVFLDPKGTPLSRIAIPNDATKVYATLLRAYNNELYDIDYDKSSDPLPPKASTKPATKTTTNGKALPAKPVVSGLPTKKK